MSPEAESSQAAQRFAGIGAIEWIRFGDRAHAEQVIRELRRLGVRRLRTQFSWADWHAEGGAAWYDWLLPRLAAELEVLPCFSYTPPSLGIEARTASPPRDPKAYADFIDQIIDRLGAHFEWVELWNEPNNLNDWDWHLDHNWEIFSDMVAKAAHWARQRGKKTLLGGMCPTDPNWLDMLGQRGVLAHFDAVGVHGFPGTWEFRGRGWAEVVSEVRAVLDRHAPGAGIWLTEVGYSTWRDDEFEQLAQLRAVLDAPVDRIYWYSLQDLHRDCCHQDGFHEDERHYHFGLQDDRGREKLLYRVWAAEGFQGVDALVRLQREHGTGLARDPRARPARSIKERPVLITGGAGFVGTNLAARLLDAGHPVLIVDNLSRPGVEHNLRWLRDSYGSRLQVEIADVRDPHLMREAVAGAAQVFHFAAQVAVTTSLDDPQADFETNLRGTFNVLEAARRARRPPGVVFTSTNKVYGALGDVALQADNARHQPSDTRLRELGVDERRPLDFHSPYGCSKGGADQYVLDYARSFDLPAIVLRMSCIYGPHQFGTEDQGWVAHFLIRALEGRTITLYGDGRQVRDILYVGDLVDGLLACQAKMPALRGQAFNIGGGPGNTTSLVELIDRIGTLTGSSPSVARQPWRTGDQRWYVSDTRAFTAATGWEPQVAIDDGLARLHAWLLAQRGAPAAARGAVRVHAA